MEVTVTLETIENIAKIITALTIIGGVLIAVSRQLKKWQDYDVRILNL